jgi:hypothetical protein
MGCNAESAGSDFVYAQDDGGGGGGEVFQTDACFAHSRREMHTKLWLSYRPLRRPKVSMEDNTKTDLKQAMRVWNEFNRLIRIRYSSGLL